MPESPPGFWTDLGAPASVDWCEPNYAVSFYVAEWWNTLSSFAIVAVGVVGIVLCARAARRWELRFPMGFWAIGIIGVGSVAFHATILKLPQASDELPMIYGSLVYLYTLRWRNADPAGADLKSRRRWQLGLGLYGAGFTAAYFAWPQLFLPFIITYASMVAYIVVRSGVIAFGREGHPLLRRLVLASACSYVGGVVLFWLPEHVFLPCDHPLQSLHLHSIFHLTSAVGTYAWIIFAMADRLRRRGEEPVLTGPVPFVAGKEDEPR